MPSSGVSEDSILIYIHIHKINNIFFKKHLGQERSGTVGPMWE